MWDKLYMELKVRLTVDRRGIYPLLLLFRLLCISFLYAGKKKKIALTQNKETQTYCGLMGNFLRIFRNVIV